MTLVNKNLFPQGVTDEVGFFLRKKTSGAFEANKNFPGKDGNKAASTTGDCRLFMGYDGNPQQPSGENDRNRQVTTERNDEMWSNHQKKDKGLQEAKGYSN